MKTKRKLNKRLILTIAGVVALVVAALVVGMIIRTMVVRDADKNRESGPSLPATVEDIQDLRVQGKEDESNKKIEDSLNNDSTNNDTRYMLYLQKGHIAYDKKQWSTAAEAYLEAEKLKETAEVAELLANVYAEADEKAKAIDYFEKAIRLTSPDNPRYDAIKEAFEMRINLLKEQS